jgi:hypothetical protein
MPKSTRLPRSGKTTPTPQALIPEDDRSGPKPAFDAEAYNVVARAAKLERIALYRSNFAVQPDYFASLQKEEAPKPRYSGGFGNQYFDAERGRATCEWKWEIKVSDKRKTTLSIDVVYLIMYSGLENCSEDNVIRYMRRVGRFASYPYFRAHVSQLNWEAGTNLPILPTIST